MMTETQNIIPIPSPNGADQPKRQDETAKNRPITNAEADEMVFSMTKSAMREPKYEREKATLDDLARSFARSGTDELIRQVRDARFQLEPVVLSSPSQITNRGDEK